MKAITLYENLRDILTRHPEVQQLDVVCRGLDDTGNEVDIKLKGVVGMGTDRWGNVVVLK
jgi:hypothetical protein